MKIAVLSDIHGNLAALDAVLADIETRQVDLTVNLGDILSGPLFPAETADRLMPLNLPTIRGNHERQLLTQATERMNLSDRYTSSRLRPDQKAWLAALPQMLQLSDDVLLVHGTPGSDLDYFLETADAHGLRPATPDEIKQRAGDFAAKLILCGHTHFPKIVRLDDARLIVNAGSVGLQAYEDDRPFPHKIEVGTPHARYAIAESSVDGWSAELIAVTYDWETAAGFAAQRGRDDWARALRTGLV